MRKIPGDYRTQRIRLMLSHGRYRDLARRALAAARRRAGIPPWRFPAIVETEVTDECMLDCVTCPRSKVLPATGRMPEALFRRIVEECARELSHDSLVFSGLGEPLLHPRCVEMTRFAKSMGIPSVRLITNAIPLTPRKTAEILEAPAIDEIGLSMDALTRETYRRVKGADHFDLAEAHIAHFLEQKRARGRWRPFVSLHIMNTRETAGEIEGFVRRWSPLLGPGDHILVKDVHTFARLVEDRSPAGFIRPAGRRPCLQLWRMAWVRRNGDVTPCCMDAGNALTLGNLAGASLRELWRRPCLREWRELHRQGRYDAMPRCGPCETWWYFRPPPRPRDAPE